jgi:Holliday junction DNA helicase RuvA
MLAFVKGELIHIGNDYIVVEAGQIGYEITVPQSVIVDIPRIGQEVKIHTYMYVREDAVNLYGFLTRDDLEVFKLLITVSGIGPKGACAILSVLTTDELKYAILADDSKTISKAPGVGSKTAQKLIIELKDKMKIEDMFTSNNKDIGNVASISNDCVGEAVQALVSLGYTSTEATKAVRAVNIDGDMRVEDLIKAALKKLI